MASTDFINECKKGAYKNRLGKIVIDGIETPITNSDNLQSFEIDSGCYVDGNIIGTTYSKKLTGSFIAVPDNIDLIDKIIYPKIGVKYIDLSDEYINMGKYTVSHPNDEQTANFTEITAYDNFDMLDNPYICNVNFEETDEEGNKITKYVSDFYVDVCNQLSLTPKTTTFLNSDIPVSGNPFTNNETLRIVLQEIEKVACSFSEIDNDNNKIDLVWLSTNEEADYEFTTSDYSELEGGLIQYGPVNSLVIKDSQIEGENVTKEDTDSITANGETQITIEDSYFLYTEELRTKAIDNIWNRVKGLTYVDCKITSLYGKPFLKIGDKIKVNTNENKSFITYVLKHTFTYDGTFKSVIESPALTKQETKIKNVQTLKKYFRRVERITNKIEGQLEDVIEQVDGQDEKINKTISTVEETTSTVSEVKNQNESITTTLFELQQKNDQLTYDFKKIGGINLLSNSSFQNGLNDWQESLQKPYIEGSTQPDCNDTLVWLSTDDLAPTVYNYTSKYGWQSVSTEPITDEVRKYWNDYFNKFYYNTQIELSDTIAKNGDSLQNEENLNTFMGKGFRRSLIHIPQKIIQGQKKFNLSLKMKGYINYGQIKITVYFLDGEYEKYNSDLNLYESYYDHIVQTNEFIVDEIKEQNFNITLDEGVIANEVAVKVEYVDKFVTDVIDDETTVDNYYSTLEGELVYFGDKSSGTKVIYKSIFQDGKVTYIESETTPSTPHENEYWYNPMEEMVYKPVWKKRKITGTINTEWYTEYEATDLTIEDIEKGITIRYFSKWQAIDKDTTMLDELNYLNFDGNVQFYEFMLAYGSAQVEWQPKNGENYWDDNIKFGPDGIKMTNKMTGETRIIDEDEDSAYDKNGEIRWQLTPTGGLVNDFEIKGKLKHGRKIEIPREDGNAIYFI